MREGTRGCVDKMTRSETALRHQPDNMVFERYVKDIGRSFYWGEGTSCGVEDVCHFSFFFQLQKAILSFWVCCSCNDYYLDLLFPYNKAFPCTDGCF